MNHRYMLALDQGTTSSRAILFDHQGNVIASAQKAFQQFFPRNGWVEHDPMEILSSQIGVMDEVLIKRHLNRTDIAGIGITNQRETTIVWDKATGTPIYPAIVWQDRRTTTYCDSLKACYQDWIQEKTGLIIDAYFSATKLKWILDNVEGARQRALAGELCFGTVDTWLLWNLTGGSVFSTDVSNASRTMLYNIHTMSWDRELLEFFNIPRQMLPEVRSCSEIYGYTDKRFMLADVPICGSAGDQQAALFGQTCFQSGMMKVTYGTGCFLLMNTGEKIIHSQHRLLSTVAWQIGDKVTYALEGGVFVGGAAIQWLRDGLKMIRSAAEVNQLAESVVDNGGVYFVPALTGLGAPYWDQQARGLVIGITRGTQDGHIARATLEGIALQVYDIIQAMQADLQQNIIEIHVDGGATASELLMQIQADILNQDIIRLKLSEATALGVAYLAGLAIGFWSSLDELPKDTLYDAPFQPNMEDPVRNRIINHWHRAVELAKGWTEE